MVIGKETDTREDILLYAVEQGIINFDDVRKRMMEEEKRKVLEKHKYKIFSGKDGRWKTTLPDETKKGGRHLIAKKSYDDLIAMLIEHYKAIEENTDVVEKLTDEWTLRKIYPFWLKMKHIHTASSSYTRRIQNDWNKYYEASDIVDVPVKSLTYLKLDEWAHLMVKKYQMTKKQYYNMAIIMRQCLDYACEPEMDIISANPFLRVKIGTKLFRKEHKPSSNTQVFLEEEQLELTRLILKKCEDNKKLITPLAILLNFQLGLRVGELVAIKWQDINKNYLSVSKMEVGDYDISETGEVIRNGTKVVEFTKSAAGTRSIYINNEARHIFNMIKKRNIELALYDNGYILLNSSGKRLTTGSINEYLYSLCDELDIAKKSSHKIRKTFISALFDKGMNIDKIREIAGHEDEKTSLNNYCFDRRSDEVTEGILDSIGNHVINFARIG